MKKLFNKEQEQFIISNYLTMKYSEIAKMLGDYTSTQITGWLNNNGYKKGHNSIFSQEDVNYIKENCMKLTYNEIADNLGFTEKQIRGWVNHNCDKKVRIFNDKYFDKIVTPNQAYWIGFIYADGYVIKNSSNRNYELGISIQSGDIKLLEDFNNELGGVHNITRSHDEKYICNNPKISVTNTVTLRVYSKNIVEDLIKNNVIQNKTQSSIFPVVEDDLFFDFLRGYIDGDGCIYVDQNKISASQVHITSAHAEVLKYIKNKLSLYGITSNVYKEKEKKYRIYINYKNALKLFDMIYYDENVQKLNRKYEKYLLLKRLS